MAVSMITNSDLATTTEHPPQTLSPDVGINALDRREADRLWTMIVGSFCLLLLGSFTALVALLFVGNAHVTLMLSVMTTVVGFLAGVVSPSPVDRRRG